ncbi:MAG: hypothetical protein LUM44_10025 [Pyrinomonadaceae bacterium]|nr:hypothetical protein [Pyrinomonadaceae bacterium]
MKKIANCIAIALLLTSLCSFSVFAGDDGIIPTGGRTCPNGQQTCLVAPVPETTDTEKPFYVEIFNYLQEFFG